MQLGNFYKDGTINKMDYRKLAIIGISIAVVVGVVVIAVYKQKGRQDVMPVSEKIKTTTAPEPKRTDYGTKLPTNFPADIPVEKGVKVEQSYSLNYVGQKQLTIVFQSTKTVKENYAIYEDFLKKENWSISNKYESAKLSSLYGTKDSNDINVTISESAVASSVKSQVSISVLKK